MIFTVELNFRNCKACGKKVSFYATQEDYLTDMFERLHQISDGTNHRAKKCPLCEAPFNQFQISQLEILQADCKRRIAQPRDNNRLHYSKFYPAFTKWNHAYAIPLYSTQEVLIVENTMHHGGFEEARFDRYIGGYRDMDQPEDGQTMVIESWQPIWWDPAREMFVAGPDEGPQTIQKTSFE